MQVVFFTGNVNANPEKEGFHVLSIFLVYFLLRNLTVQKHLFSPPWIKEAQTCP